MQSIIRHFAFTITTLSLSLMLTQIVWIANSHSTHLSQSLLAGTTGFDQAYTIAPPTVQFDCTGDYIESLQAQNPPPNPMPIGESDCSVDSEGSPCVVCDQDFIARMPITATPSRRGADYDNISCGVANAGFCEYNADDDAYHCQGRPTNNNCITIASGTTQSTQ